MYQIRIVTQIVLLSIGVVLLSGCSNRPADRSMATTEIYVAHEPIQPNYYPSYRSPYHHYPYYTNHSAIHRVYSRNFAHMRSYQDDPSFWYPGNFYLGGYLYLYDGFRYQQSKEISPSPLKGFQGETITQLPEGSVSVTINSKIYYLSKKIIYRKVETEGGEMYEAVGIFNE